MRIQLRAGGPVSLQPETTLTPKSLQEENPEYSGIVQRPMTVARQSREDPSHLMLQTTPGTKPKKNKKSENFPTPPASTNSQDAVPGQRQEAGRTPVQPMGQCTLLLTNTSSKKKNKIKRELEPDPIVVGRAGDLSAGDDTDISPQPVPAQDGSPSSTPGKVTNSLSGRSKKRSRKEPVKRKKWTKDENTALMLAYYQCQPGRTGYRKRLHAIWTSYSIFPRSEQQLADQVRSVLSSKHLSDKELTQVQMKAATLQKNSPILEDLSLGPATPLPSQAVPSLTPHPDLSQSFCSDVSFTVPPPTPPVAHSTPVQRAPPTPPLQWTSTHSLPSTAHITVDSEVSFNIPVAPPTPPQPSPPEDQNSPAETTPSFVSQAISELRRAAELLPPPTTEEPAPPEDPADLKKRILHLMEHPEEIETKTLRHVDHRKLKAVTAKINLAVTSISTADLTETNTMLRAASHVAREELGEKMPQQPSQFKEPKWKRRIEEKIEQDRKDLSHLKIIGDGGHLKKKITDGLERRHPLLKKKGIKTISEELKQRVVAKAAKIKRFKQRCDRYKEGKLFKTNQRQFYRNLSSGPSTGLPAPTEDQKKEFSEFWNGIWGSQTEHNRDAPWIPHIKDQITSQTKDQSPLAISEDNLKARVKKMANWSSPGMDGLHAYWMKHLTNTHSRIASQMQDCILTSSVPAWMTSGKTHLIIKDPSKGFHPGNFRPITCLPNMWKLFTGIISVSVYNHITSQGLFPDEQKGCRSMSRGCKEQLLIDKLLLKNCKRRKTNLHMAYIDYKKAYDRIPHSWILECLRWCKVDPLIISLFEATFQQSSVHLHLGQENLGMVKILRGIFQGDSISPLQFIIGLIPLSLLLRGTHAGYKLSSDGPEINHRLYMDDLKLYGRSNSELKTLLDTTKTFSDDICMEFGIDKCASVTIRKGKKISTEGVTLPDGSILQDVTEEGYRYLGILEADKIYNMKMKEVTTRTYLQRVKKILKSQLDGKSTFQAINTWAVPVIRYSAGIVDWTQSELKELDSKTRKKLKLSGSHHPQADVDRLYIPRRAGGRGLQSIEEVVHREENSLATFIEDSTNPELIALKPFFHQEKIIKGQRITKEEDKDKDQKKRTEDWTSKNLHGQFPAAVKAHADPADTWEWLHRSDLKRETEGLLVAAQDQALRTNWIRSKIHKDGTQSSCRLCHNLDETIDHVLSGCSKLAQGEYKARHDKVAAALHWNLCKKFGFEHHHQWYNHHAEKVLENESVKLLWDFHIQTDHVVEHCRPDLLLVDKKKKEAIIIDVAVPGDSRIKIAEQRKIESYQDLKREIKKIWQLKSVTVIPIVIGAQGAVTPQFKTYLKNVHCPFAVSTLQKTALLGSAHILRKVLDM